MSDFNLFTAPFNDMWTLKFKAKPRNAFSLKSFKCSAATPSLNQTSAIRCMLSELI